LSLARYKNIFHQGFTQDSDYKLDVKTVTHSSLLLSRQKKRANLNMLRMRTHKNPENNDIADDTLTETTFGDDSSIQGHANSPPCITQGKIKDLPPQVYLTSAQLKLVQELKFKRNVTKIKAACSIFFSVWLYVCYLQENTILPYYALPYFLLFARETYFSFTTFKFQIVHKM